MKNELMLINDSKSSIAEAIRIIQTNLDFTVNKKIKTILVTSSIPGEGKSFVSSNLACSFAQSNMKVLLIDCDLRKGRLHKIFNLKNETGLSNFLLEEIDKDFNHYIGKTNIENLHVLSKGIVPANPSVLLDSPKIKLLLNVLKEKYDVIILDGTPVTGLNDALILTKMVDTVTVVSTCNYTKIEQLQNTIRSLKTVNANIAGIIMNKIPTKNNGYYYYE